MTTAQQLPLPRHVLITGVAGRLGRVVLAHLRRLGVQVTGLALADPGDLDVDRLVVGDASDRSMVDLALQDVDAVVHLAALAAPVMGTPEEVFTRNTAATFTVLEAAGAHGIRRVALASSVNAVGVGWSFPHVGSAAYVPLDEEVPCRPADAYSLSKFVDEQTAHAAARRYGMSVVSLRFPLIGTLEGNRTDAGSLHARARRAAAEPAVGAPELWLYIEERDAAAALERAIRLSAPGAHEVFVAAERTYSPYATEELLRRFHPGTTRRRSLPGRSAPVDLSRARQLLGFAPQHLLPDPASSLDLPMT